MADRMTTEAAVATLGMLALRYAPRPMPWADNGADEATRVATMRAWVDVMARYSAGAVLAAVEQVCTEQPNWSPNLNEFHQACQAQARRLASDQTRQRALGAVRCDGSGWVQHPGAEGLRPCPACNPFLHSEWSQGTLTDHGPQRTVRRQKWLDENGGMPDPCRQPMPGLTVDPKQGMAIAWRAMVEAAQAEGRQPSKSTFAYWQAKLGQS